MELTGQEESETDAAEVRRDLMITEEILAELEHYFGLVDMKSMPTIPETAPCRATSKPDIWCDNKCHLPESTPLAEVDKKAKELCEGCPVLEECLVWGLNNLNQDGVLGGTTHKRRKKIMRFPDKYESIHRMLERHREGL